MSRPAIIASAPGSLMLSGEHAVLHGRHALAGAVDRRIIVTITPRKDDSVVLSSALGERHMSRSLIDSSAPFSFAGAVLDAHAADMPAGCDIDIKADVPHDVGLGSSAAVTVALLAGLRTWIAGAQPQGEDLMHEAIGIIRGVQGLGSGADVAACVSGGIVLYSAVHPQVLERFVSLPEIALVYAGYKTPTPEVVRRVEDARQGMPEIYEALFDRFEDATQAAAVALRSEDWPALGRAMDQGQLVMTELGVSDDTLEALVADIHATPGIVGSKISGSGLGDCVLGIGTLSKLPHWPFREIPVSLSRHGVTVE